MDIKLVNNLFLFFGLMILAKEDHESCLISNKKLSVLAIFKLTSDILSILHSYSFDRPAMGPALRDLYLRLLLAFTVTLILFLLAILMPEALGMGDVKLIGSLVLYLGPATLLLMALSFTLLLSRATFLKLRKVKVDKLPLAPFVFAAYIFFLMLIYI